MHRDIYDLEEMWMKIIKNIVVDDAGYGDEILFNMNDGSVYRMHHEQDCCESVVIEDICGDVNAIKDALITNFEEVISHDEEGGYDDSNTWTFYKIDTLKGDLVIRWCGSSNGYYSESVSFAQIA